MGSFLDKLFVDPSTLPGGLNCGGDFGVYSATQPDDPLDCAACEWSSC